MQMEQLILEFGVCGLVWEGDKVVTEYRYFDPANLYVEVAASQTK